MNPKFLHFVHPITLWLGTYVITCSILFYEKPILKDALLLGLVSATLKTVWALLHKAVTHKPVHIEEDLRA